MALAILLGVVDAALVFQFVIGIRDYRRRCDGFAAPRLLAAAVLPLPHTAPLARALTP